MCGLQQIAKTGKELVQEGATGSDSLADFTKQLAKPERYG